MPTEQTEIFYLTGESRELMEQSPHLEAFRAKGWEVLLLSDPVDEFVVDTFHEYKGKKLKAVDKAGLDPAIAEDKKKQFQPLLDFLKEKIADIKEARLTTRLKASAVCLVAEEGDMSAHMERLMQRMGRGQPSAPAKRILEVNPDHPLIERLESLRVKDPGDARLEKMCRLLYDQAVITEGSKVKDPLAFAERLNEFMMRDLAALEK
jgi:molecular chaperone HtpG